ncbi:MAG: DUF4150 domain-containing protein [Desulfovibrionaceae bacterium]
MYACTIQKGNLMSEIDVCKTPTPAGPIPTPYPNIGMTPTADPPCSNVLIVGSPALNLECQIPMTNGDQAGAAMGMVSGEIMGEAKFTIGSETVTLEGSPAVRMGDPTTHNSNNAIGSCLVPSQSKLMIMS